MVELSNLRRETLRKTIATLAMVLDYHGSNPNPARDKRVRLPQEDRLEVNPPTANHVIAVYGVVPPAYRLPLLALDATGMRVGELEALTWGDVDEQSGRWRVTQAGAKTNTARWVPVPEIILQAVTDTVPRRSATSLARCSPASVRTGCVRRSRGRARLPVCRRLALTTCGIAALHSGTCRASRPLRQPLG